MHPLYAPADSSPPHDPPSNERQEPTGSNVKMHVCRNCGVAGHLYKECPQPIMSFGLICYRYDNDEHPTSLQYLMIQRKDSLSFIEFIRGRYDPSDRPYLSRLIENMTDYERDYLIRYNFKMLWNHVWHQTCLPRETQEFHDAKEKFEALRRGTHGVMLATLVESTAVQFDEPEWGFPKGRRRLKESDVDCAVREFCEETGCHRNHVILDEGIPPFGEIFYGTNNVLYRHVYYVARLAGCHARTLAVDLNNVHQAREVRKIEWFDHDAILDHIRPHNVERKALFEEAHELLVKKVIRVHET